jgi:hypothetical protein
MKFKLYDGEFWYWWPGIGMTAIATTGLLLEHRQHERDLCHVALVWGLAYLVIHGIARIIMLLRG